MNRSLLFLVLAPFSVAACGGKKNPEPPPPADTGAATATTTAPADDTSAAPADIAVTRKAMAATPSRCLRACMTGSPAADRPAVGRSA